MLPLFFVVYITDKMYCYLGQKVQSGEIDASRATVIEDTGIGWGVNHIWASRNITSP